MKKRIVALILTVVMSLLALTSCNSGFDFVEENLNDYADFKVEDFKKALEALEIEDGEFTTDDDTRKKIVAATIYNAIADKIVASTDEEDRLTAGTLGAGDVLYFVYYAVDKNGNTFFANQMNESTITSNKAEHVLKLDDYLDGKGDEFLKLVAENLAEGDLADYVYDMLTSSELQSKAEEALKAEKPAATEAEIKAAKADAIKVKVGDTISITYTRKYPKDGNTVTEKASYEVITLDAANPLHQKFLEEGAVANVGSKLEAVTGKNGDTVTKDKKFKVTIDGVEYEYSDVNIDYKVASKGQAIAVFDYVKYPKEDDTTTKPTTPNNLSKSGTTVDLAGETLTYHVFPVYAIDTPSYEEITAEDILYHIYGKNISEKTFEAFKDETYKNGDKKLADLLKEVADIFDTKSEDNDFYKEGENLKNLLDAHTKAVEAGGSNPSTAQKEVITKALEALTDAQNELLKGTIAKIVAATNSKGEKLGDAISEEYYEATFHSLKESYDSDIVKKVQKAVWNLILDDEILKVKAYPTELVEEYVELLRESYEYDFYKGDFDKDSSNYDEYKGDFNKFLDAELADELKVAGKGKYDEALAIQAKEAIDPIIRIYVVAKALNSDAVKAMPGYIDLDEKGGLYKIDEEAYKDTYGDKAAEKIKEAIEKNKESLANAKEDADKFLIDDAYMKDYKKDIGSAYYKDLCKEYGETNLRAAFQFNRLFYYLTSTNYEWNAEEGHAEIKYVNGLLDFRTVKYTFASENETENKN